jgi:hypothetical protein
MSRSIKSIRASQPTLIPSSIDAIRGSVVIETMTSAMSIDLSPPVPVTTRSADQVQEPVPMEVADLALSGLAQEKEDDKEDDSDEESIQSDVSQEELIEIPVLPPPCCRSDLSERVIREAKLRGIEVEWLCCIDSEIPVVKPSDLEEPDDDDDEEDRDEKKCNNKWRVRVAKCETVERLLNIAQLRDLPPCPWMDENGEFKTSWFTTTGVEMEVMTNLSKQSLESKQLFDMFIHRLDKMGDYTIPSQMQSFLADMNAHMEREKDRKDIAWRIRKKFTTRQLKVLVGQRPFPIALPYVREKGDQVEELIEDIIEMSQLSRLKYQSIIHEYVDGYKEYLSPEQQQRVQDVMAGAFPADDRPLRIQRSKQRGIFIEFPSPYYSAKAIEYKHQQKLATDQNLQDMYIPLTVCGMKLAQVNLFKQVVIGSLDGFLHVTENLLRAKCLLLPTIKGEMYQVEPYRMPIDVENMVVALMYYIQEFARIGQPIPKPQVLEGVDEEQLVTRPYQKVDLLLALEHAAIRKRFCEASTFWSERYHPGKFIANVGQFGVWEEKLVKFLSGIPGSSCVPLSYVIRDQRIVKVLNAESHMDSLVILAPHSGTYYSNDTAEVFNIIMECISPDVADLCTSDESCFGDGCLMMEKLRNYFKNDVGGTAESPAVGMSRNEDLYSILPDAAGSASNINLQEAIIPPSTGSINQVSEEIIPEQVDSTTGTLQVMVQAPVAPVVNVTVNANQMERQGIVSAARTGGGTSRSARRRRRARAVMLDMAITEAQARTQFERQRVAEREQLAIEAERRATSHYHEKRQRTSDWIPSHQWNRMTGDERRDVRDRHDFQMAMHGPNGTGRGGGSSHWGHSDRY